MNYCSNCLYPVKAVNLIIDDNAIVEAVDLSTRYITDRYLPDKAIDLIDEACSTKSMKYDFAEDEIEKLKLEIEKLQKELDYTQGFLKSVEEKLNNEHFANNAPEQVVENEKNKMTDAKAKIEILATKIKDLASA